jgi:phosphoglycerol transferase MdoB-like AlkP superfamily enzyme
MTSGTGNKKYACRQYMLNGKLVRILMHRGILNPENSKLQVDHIDGNPMNNQRSNLRLCTNQENAFNKQIGSNNTSGYKGVYFTQNSWVAKITKDGKNRYERFDSKEEAKNAYNRKATKLFGEFALVNTLDMSKHTVDPEIEKVSLQRQEETLLQARLKAKNKCPDCETEINKNSTRCTPCTGKQIVINSRATGRPPLSVLLEEHSRMTMVAMGEKYKVSNNCVKNWIRKYRKFDLLE